MTFDHLLPTRVVFGRGRSSEIGAHAAAVSDTALVVCGARAMRRLGVLDAVRHQLTSAGMRVEVFDQISPDPGIEEVQAAVDIARAERSGVIVGLGGGSAMDAAKAVGVAVHGGDVGHLVGTTLAPSSPRVPVIAVPTTAGSGAEVTKGAIITDRARGAKTGIRGEPVFPMLAVVDPELTATAPPPLAAETGFDALTHAVEALVARAGTPVSDALATHAIALLAQHLPRLAAGERSDEVTDGLAAAALLGGFCVATASTCLPHRLQQAMGAEASGGLSHGRGLAALYPAWLSRSEPHRPERFGIAARLLGASSVADAVARLRESLQLEGGLAAGGYSTEDVDAFLDRVHGNVGNDPMPAPDRDVMREIYLESW